ncbi:unnamed protein product [Phytomonas sp. Hart1]|nr:unnamed protein product [Phytomonas sp. Hart1]|eukprot:CCW70222.1 unnamed protein product [Phytomonas sp. isolate Hart1]
MTESETSDDQKLHPLKDDWFVYYIPAVKDVASYDDACVELDYVHSIEEVFAVLNTFPNVTILPSDDSIVFSRKKIPPNFESFPDGHRISFFTKTKAQADDCISRTVAAVLGESILKSLPNDGLIVDLVRISHKPHRLYEEASRIEVWSHQSSHEKEMEAYFKDLLKLIPGITIKPSKMM